MFRVTLISAITSIALGLDLGKLTKGTRIRISDTIMKDIVDDIRNKTRLWQPYEPEENPLANKTDDELQGLLGVMADDDEYPELLGAIPKDNSEWSRATYTPFDSRSKWGDCIHPVMN